MFKKFKYYARQQVTILYTVTIVHSDIMQYTVMSNFGLNAYSNYAGRDG